MITARGISYRIGGRQILDGIDLDIEPGALTVLIGPNGAGKSTLLRILTGELAPSAGTLTIGARPFSSHSASDFARLRAVVPQHTTLNFPFTVVEVVDSA